MPIARATLPMRAVGAARVQIDFAYTGNGTSVGTVDGKGVTAVRNGVGDTTFTLPGPGSADVLSVTATCLGSADLTATVEAITEASRTVQLITRSGGTAADLSSAQKVFVSVVLRNTNNPGA